MSTLKNFERTKRIVGLAILSAIIIVLQIICTFIKFGPVNITLALAPIIIGAAIYGVWSGAFLGAVLGVVVLIAGLFSWDGGFTMMLFSIHPVVTALMCILKTTFAGLLAGLVYKAIEKKNATVAVFTAGVVCPVVNTGTFILGMFVFFIDTLKGFAEGQNLLWYSITGFAGINFVVELVVNMLLATAISQIIRVVKKRH